MNKTNNYAYFNGGFYYKDEDGVVWQVIKTPYKEIPIVNLEAIPQKRTLITNHLT